MKRIFIAYLVIFSFQFVAQDTIYFKNSKKIAVLLLESNPNSIKYKRFDNQGGPSYTILKSEIAYIAYTDGKKESFENPETIDKKEQPVVKKDTVVSIPVQAPKNLALVADTIYFKSGKITEAKVTEITVNEIKYKLFDYIDGPAYQATRSEVKQITFASGMVQQFNDAPKTEVNDYPVSSGGNAYAMYKKGKDDAYKYFDPKGGRITTGCAASIPLWGIGMGLVPALIFSNIKPNQKNMLIPISENSKNKEYVAGYTEWAAIVKKKKIWRAYGISAGLSTAITLGIILLLSGL